MTSSDIDIFDIHVVISATFICCFRSQCALIRTIFSYLPCHTLTSWSYELSSGHFFGELVATRTEVAICRRLLYISLLNSKQLVAVVEMLKILVATHRVKVGGAWAERNSY